MLLVNPRRVYFGSTAWEGVTLVMVDRRAEREVVEWGDGGPYAVFADVAEQRVTLRVVREVTTDDVDAPRPGESGVVRFYTSPGGTEAGRKRITATGVVTRVTHEIGPRVGAVRTVEFVLVGASGAADPIQVTEAGGES